MRLGIGTYTFAWAIGVPGSPPAKPMSAFDLLDEATRLKVGVVQFCDNLPLVKLPASELDSFHRRLAELDLGKELPLLEGGLARIDHDVILVIDHALKLATGEVEHEADA